MDKEIPDWVREQELINEAAGYRKVDKSNALRHGPPYTQANHDYCGAACRCYIEARKTILCEECSHQFKYGERIVFANGYFFCESCWQMAYD